MAINTTVLDKLRREFEDPAQTARDMHFSRLPMWRRMKDEEFCKKTLVTKLALLEELTLQELEGEL